MSNLLDPRTLLTGLSKAAAPGQYPAYILAVMSMAALAMLERAVTVESSQKDIMRSACAILFIASLALGFVLVAWAGIRAALRANGKK